MPSAKAILFALLGFLTAVFVVFWAAELSRQRAWRLPSLFQSVVGFIADFLDTLGIGSFATTTTFYRLWKAVPDEKIPGTLTVGHALPTITQAFIYIERIKVDSTTLTLLILASVLGSWFGAGIVTRLSRRRIQIGMGCALLVAAALLLAKVTGRLPAGNQAEGLEGIWLLVALVANFAFGALMTIGVGAYAPIMIMVSLLGMNPKAAFPIMMGSCAFLMPVSGFRFIRAQSYDPRAALGLTLAGIPAVLLAASIVEGLRLELVFALVIVVVLYTATTMLWSAMHESEAKAD